MFSFIKSKFFIGIIMLLLVNSLNGQEDYIISLESWSIEDGLSDRNVHTIFKDKDGLLWLGTRNGLNSFDGYEFRHWLGKQDGVDLSNITRISQDDEGWLWLQRQDNLIFFNPDTEEFQTITGRFGEDCILNTFSDSHYAIKNFLVDDEGRIFYKKYGEELYYYYHSKEGFKKANSTQIKAYQTHFYYAPIPNVGLNYKDFKYDRTWRVLGDNTIEVSDLAMNRLITFKLEKNVEDEKIFINEIISDNAYQIWICTQFGFYLATINQKTFHFTANPKVTNGTKLAARSILNNKNILEVALEPDYIGEYQETNNKWTLQRKKGTLSSYKINEEEYWRGGFKYLEYIKNGVTEQFTVPDFKHFVENTVWSICRSTSDEHTLLLGTKKGLMSFNTLSKKFTTHPTPPDISKDTFNLIQSIIPDKQLVNHYWLCSDKGLFLYDETKGFIAKYNKENKDEYFLPSQNVQHLHQDNDGNYWIATSGDGVIRWDKKNNSFQQFTQKDGLANDVIYAIYEDSYGNIWMSSDYGIIKMNTKNLKIQNFTPDNGIGQKEFNRISHLQTDDGQIYFGGLDGITRFHPKDFERQAALFSPQLILSKYVKYNGKKREANDETTLVKRSYQTILKPSDYIIDLQFSILSFTHLDNNSYSYQLTKRGKPYTDWQTQKKRAISLGQLPYGKYELTVKGRNAYNIATANEIVLEIIILRPFYLTWWFLLIAVILLFAIGYIYTTWRTRTLQLKQEKLEAEVLKATEKIRKDKRIIEAQAEDLRKLDELKTRFFANVSHELRTPLTLMLGPIKSVLKRNDIDNKSYTFLSTAEQNGHQLLKLVNEILDLNKLEAGKLQLNEETVNFYSFIKRIVANFMSYAESTNILFRFNYQLEKETHLLLDTHKVETILNNLLSNAFKFTGKNGVVEVNVVDEKNQIKISVIDTGRGVHVDDLPNIFDRFYQSKQNQIAEGGTGIGLALCKEFMELLGGRIWVESKYGAGSQFHIEIPRKEVLKTMSNQDYEIHQTALHELTPPILAQDKASQTAHLNTVLLVEDNRSLQNYLKLILEEHYQVTIANNGEEALGVLQKEQFSLIISDIMMPIMDGYTLLKHLKEHDEYRQIPVVMLTAKANKEDRLNALRIGVDDYLLKPFDEDELLARIANLIQNNIERQKEWGKISQQPPLSASTKTTNIFTQENSEWLKALEKKVFELVITVPSFTTETLAQEMAISRRQLNRKIKEYTGLTPNKYIVEIRLQKARILLEQTADLTVKEVSYKVGFSKTEYFSKLFKARFGKNPSELIGILSSN